MIKIFGLLTAICIASALTVSTASAGSELAEQLQKLLARDKTTADYARLKLTIDKMVDPSIDIDANIRQIDHIYAAERRIGYEAMRAAGVSREQARQAIKNADDYFGSIGVTRNTPTRLPGRRR